MLALSAQLVHKVQQDQLVQPEILDHKEQLVQRVQLDRRAFRVILARMAILVRRGSRAIQAL